MKMSETLSKEEKRRFLKALEEDEEFRYAVAGLIGISEILKRLDKIEANQEKLWLEVKNLRENQEKLWLEVKSLRENQEKLWVEVKSLREGQEKLWLEIKNIWLEVKNLREEQEKLWIEVKNLRENQEKLWLEVKNLRDNQEKLWLEVKNLREGQEKLWMEVKNLWLEVKSLRENQEEILNDLRELRVSFERLTLSVEEEGRDVIRCRLKDELNVDIPLDRIWVDGREINIYGTSGDLCVIGEATVRLGVKLLEELEEKIDYIRGRKPDLLKPRMIKVVYVDYAVPSALEKARDRGIWVVKWSGDLTPRVIHST